MMAAPQKKTVRWQVVKPWFSAHTIPKLDNSFIVTAKYAQFMNIFVTGTSKGEVKLWSNTMECLGVLNSQENPWDSDLVMKVISSVQRGARDKELKEEAK